MYLNLKCSDGHQCNIHIKFHYSYCVCLYNNIENLIKLLYVIVCYTVGNNSLNTFATFSVSSILQREGFLKIKICQHTHFDSIVKYVIE